MDDRETERELTPEDWDPFRDLTPEEKDGIREYLRDWLERAPTDQEFHDYLAQMAPPLEYTPEGREELRRAVEAAERDGWRGIPGEQVFADWEEEFAILCRLRDPAQCLALRQRLWEVEHDTPWREPDASNWLLPPTPDPEVIARRKAEREAFLREHELGFAEASAMVDALIADRARRPGRFRWNRRDDGAGSDR